ncbi:MAG: hypothetical protein Kow0037_15280 [Calditrichia bacterium]
MYFNVDATLLNFPVADDSIGLVYAPPKGMEELPDSVKSVILERMLVNGTENEMFKLVPHRIFWDKLSGNLFSISILPNIKETPDSEPPMNLYTQMLREQKPAAPVRTAKFLKDGLRMYQYLLQLPQHINFRLFMFSPRGQFLQLDYIYKKATYQNHIEAIESSIGSIKPNKSN